jgi:D-alanyl-D-alanine carboxypeptidase
LGHTAGVPSWEDDPAWIRKGRGSGLDPTHHWGKTEALAYIRGHAALAAPGVAFSYSNSGYTLLGLMIEKSTGHTAVSEIRRRLLLPLGLRDTYFEGFEPGQPDRVPHRYHYATPQFRTVAGMAPSFVTIAPELIDVGTTDLSDEWTAGAMISSPRDLVTFAMALRDGKLLKPASLAFMEQWAPALPGMKVGHGLFEFDTDAGPSIGHTGGVLGFSASLWWSEKGDAVVAVMANGSSMHAGKTPPNAATVALRSDFARLAARFAAQQETSH